MNLPKVLIIHTGGTLGMPLSPRAHVLRPTEFKNEIIQPLTFLRKIADIEIDIFLNIDSSDVDPHHWQRLAKKIDKKIDEVDGVVVIHGTDTLAWTSTALSLMLKGIKIPVVLTGSQKPLNALRSDAPRNLLNAIEIAAKGPPGVMVVFDNRILSGSSVTKDSIFHFDAFRSNHSITLGRIGLDISFKKINTRKKKYVKYWLDTRLDAQVGFVTLYPGYQSDWVIECLKSSWHALVIEAFGAGNVPLGTASWENVLQHCSDLKIPLVVTSSCRHGQVNPDLYYGAQKARQLGAAFGFGMSREAAIIKTMILLGRKTPYRRFVKEFEKDWCGEVNCHELDVS